MLKTFGADSKRSARRRAFLEPKTQAAVRHRSGQHTAHESTPRAAHDGAGHSCRDRRPTLMPLVRHAAVPAPERARCCRPRLSLAHVAFQRGVATSSPASSSRPSSRQAPAARQETQPPTTAPPRSRNPRRPKGTAREPPCPRRPLLVPARGGASPVEMTTRSRRERSGNPFVCLVWCAIFYESVLLCG